MSCDKEKLSIPLEAHHKAQWSEIFLFSGKNLKELSFFHLLANPAETAYLNFWDRELSNDVWLVEFWWREVVVHTFLWVVTGHCLRAGIIESHNFFVLRRILVKFHIRTRLIQSFAMTYWSWWCAKEKLHFTPVHTLCQLKCDEALFPPLPINLADRNGLKNLPRQIFSACVKFGGNPCRDVETLCFYTHRHTHRHTDAQTHRHTCTNEIIY